MHEIASIVVADQSVPCTSAIMGVLRFFGVEAQVSTPHQFLADILAKEPNSRRIRMFSSSSTLRDVLKRLDRSPEHVALWRSNVHSVFVYTDHDAAALQELEKRILTNDPVPLIRFDQGRHQWLVSDKFPEFCGAMSGLRVTAKQGPAQMASSVQLTEGRSGVLVKGVWETVPIYLVASDTVVDVEAPLADRNFDIRTQFLSAVPIVMYVKWAFGTKCWHSDATEACLVIDDPLLKPTYGFLNYQDLLRRMERYNFTTNVAFIPWNWKRCDESVVGLFKTRSERYSMSIHGCDHTGGEFGTTDLEHLTWKSRQAVDRMTRMEAELGLHHDRIMVFPQGVFSGVSMVALKNTQYLAAVNTEVMSHDGSQLPITVSDVWDVAVMRYECFPLFTRRYPSHGIENFAFDILLGKPCIVVGHHDICRNEQADLIGFVQQLNALNCRLSWRSLGEVVKRSHRKKERGTRIVDVEMYGGELHLENRSSRQQSFHISKRESDKTAVKEVWANAHPIFWEFVEGYVRCEIMLGAGESVLMRIVLHNDRTTTMYHEDATYKFKVRLRRYLSEMRDNYVAVWGA